MIIDSQRFYLCVHYEIILSMFIAAGVCTPQGVWIRAIG